MLPIFGRDTICGGRSVWFAGKYMIISYELVVLVLAWYSLKYGKPIPFNFEFALHVGISLVGLLVTVTFATECSTIWKRVDQLHQSNPSYEDALNGTLMQNWKGKYHSGLGNYNDLMANYLRVWAALLTFVMITWAAIRIVLHKLLKSMHHELLSQSDISKVQRITLLKLHETKRKLFFKVRLLSCFFVAHPRLFTRYWCAIRMLGLIRHLANELKSNGTLTAISRSAL